MDKQVVLPATNPILILLSVVTGGAYDQPVVNIEDYLHRDWVSARRRRSDSFWTGRVLDGDLTIQHAYVEEVTGDTALEILANWNALVVADALVQQDDFKNEDVPLCDGNLVSIRFLPPTALEGEESYPLLVVSCEAASAMDHQMGDDFADIMLALLAEMEKAEEHGYRVDAKELALLQELLLPTIRIEDGPT